MSAVGYDRRDLGSAAEEAAHVALLTAEEVAALLRMTPAWVYSETRRNRIPHLRLGRYCRYRRSAIEAWMDQLEAASVTPMSANGRQRSANSKPTRLPVRL